MSPVAIGGRLRCCIDCVVAWLVMAMPLLGTACLLLDVEVGFSGVEHRQPMVSPYHMNPRHQRDSRPSVVVGGGGERAKQEGEGERRERETTDRTDDRQDGEETRNSQSDRHRAGDMRQAHPSKGRC
jgi:hypothetical protein